MTAIRESWWHEGVHMTREPYTDDRPVVAPAREGFVPPAAPQRSRLVPAGAGGMMQEVFDDGEPLRDAHYSDRDLAREAAKAARDSILRPAHLANRGTNHD
jgi:hypothetical protein